VFWALKKRPGRLKRYDRISGLRGDETLSNWDQLGGLMRKLILRISVLIDGFIESSDGKIDFA
jgi:hypothetical protein